MRPIISVAAIVMLLLPAPALCQSNVRVAGSGNDNRILVDQSAAIASQVDVDQIGDLNAIMLRQAGSAQMVAVTANGARNSIDTLQQGPGGNALALHVDGQDNDSRIDQSAVAGGANSMAIAQWGDRNILSASQTAYAGANSLALAQNGNDNIATLSQYGDNNRLDLTQNGDGNAAALSQTGNGLGLTLNQMGGATIMISQTGP